MSAWGARKARLVLAALLRIGWHEVRRTGSHRTLARQGWPNYVFSFHDGEEIGLRMLSRRPLHRVNARRPLDAKLAARKHRGTLMALSEKELVKLMAQIHRKYPAGGRRYSTIIEDPYKSGYMPMHRITERDRRDVKRRGLAAAG